MFNFNVNDGMEEHEYFSEKNIEDLTIEELAYVHLKNVPSRIALKNCYLSSSLHDLVETLSASFNNYRTNQYVPLMTSFAILDQLGALYTSKTKVSRFTNGIKKSLNCFSNLPDDEIEKIVSLRNGVLHDGSLTNISRFKNGSNVIFRLNKNHNLMVAPPQKEWDGIYRDSLEDYISQLNLSLLKNMILDIYQKHFIDLKSGNLNINITSPKEFYYKYLFATIKNK